MLVGRRIAPLPLVGVASTLVLVPALVGVAALLGVTALVGVPDLLGVVALARVARAWVARLGRVAARLGWIPPRGSDPPCGSGPPRGSSCGRA